jgi:hypothetical protein
MLVEQSMSQTPDRMLALIDTANPHATSDLAQFAVEAARANMPRITGHLASTLMPAFGPNFWGIAFPDKRVWFLEQGTNPFTMNSLAGKTIPMWVDDPDGLQAKQNPKAETRFTEDGRKQIKIFRKAAKKGTRKNIVRNGKIVSVPASYPGAPGRIGGRTGAGRIASGNAGVRWRHPGIESRFYLNQAMESTAARYGITVPLVYLVDAATYPLLIKT